MEEQKKLALPEGEETLRRELREPAHRLGLLLLLPAALLLLLAALSIAREAGAIQPVYTVIALGGLFCLILLARVLASGEGKAWLVLLLIGAVALRMMFALKWTVYPHGDYLTGWNLALELSRAGMGEWGTLIHNARLAGGAPFALYESLLIRLFGPTLAAVQLPNAVWGGVSCLLTALIAEKWSGSRLTGLMAGAILAFCPTLLFAAGVLTVMPLYTALLLAGLWLLVCRPFARTLVNHGLAGAAWALCLVLEPGLPVPLLGVIAWFLLTLPGRKRDGSLWKRAAILAVVLLAVWLAAGGVTVDGELSLGELVQRVRTQFGSYDYSWARVDGGGPTRNKIVGTVMHPFLQSYMLGVLLLALWGTLAKVKSVSRGALLSCGLLLAGGAAAMVLKADPVYNGWAIPLFALWGGAPARKLADWTVLMAAPEKGKGRKKAPPLPVPLRVVKLVVSVAAYAAMLALVLIFFTGNGVFVYEAF